MMSDQVVYNNPPNQTVHNGKNNNLIWAVLAGIVMLLIFLYMISAGDTETSNTAVQDPQATQTPQDPQSTQVPQMPQETQVPQNPQATQVPQIPQATQVPQSTTIPMPTDPMPTDGL